MPDVELKPSEIYFLHDSIHCLFQDGTPILDTFKELLYKRINPSLIRKIAVHYTDGKWRVYAGNRRLYIYKRLERLGVVNYIPAWKVWRVDECAWIRRNTTENGGTSVEIRNDPEFDVKIKCIINEWKTATGQDSINWTDSKENIVESSLHDDRSNQDHNENVSLHSIFHGQQISLPESNHSPDHSVIHVSEASSYGVEQMKTSHDENDDSSVDSIQIASCEPNHFPDPTSSIHDDHIHRDGNTNISLQSTFHGQQIQTHEPNYTPDDCVIHYSAASYPNGIQEMKTDSPIDSLQIASQEPIQTPDTTVINVSAASHPHEMPKMETTHYENENSSIHNLQIASLDPTHIPDNAVIDVGAATHRHGIQEIETARHDNGHSSSHSLHITTHEQTTKSDKRVINVSAPSHPFVVNANETNSSCCSCKCCFIVIFIGMLIAALIVGLYFGLSN